MALVPYTAAWVHQPTNPTGLDWSNPHTRGLFAAVCGTSPIELVNGIPLRIGGSPLFVATPDGLAGPRFNGSSSFQWAPIPTTTLNEWTLLQVVRANSPETDRRSFGFRSSLSTQPLVTLGTGVTNPAKMRLSARSDSGDFPAEVETAGDAYVATRSTVIALRHQISDGYRAFIDGVSQGNNPFVPAGPYTVDRVGVGCVYATGAAALFAGDSFVAFGWSRALSNQEIAEISSNPWQLFEPERIWVPVSSGSLTTSVQNDQLLNYLVRAGVQQDQGLDYLVRSAVQSDRDLSYTLGGVPGFNGQAFDSVAFYANAPLAQVLSELQLSYTTRAGVTNDRLLNYNVLSSVSNDRNLDYLVRSSAQQDLLQSYLVRSAVARDLGIDYLLRNAVLGNLGISYSVLTSVQNDRSLDYLVRSAVTQNQNLSYPVAGAVTSSVALNYLVRAAVSQNRDLAWSIFQAGVVTNDLLLNYGIAGSVAQNQSLNYLVRASVAQNQGLNYNILTSAAQNLSLNYLVRAGVIQDRLLSYGIAGATTSDLPLNWATRVAVAQNQSLAYSVLTSVAADRQVSYAVRAAIARELEVTYGIRSAVAQNLALNYQVFMSVPVAQNLSLAWAVFQSDGSVGLEQILLKSPITLLVQYPSHISPTISLKSPVR